MLTSVLLEQMAFSNMSHRIDCQKKCEGFQLIPVMIFFKKIVWASGTQGEDLSSPIKVLHARKEIGTLLTWLNQKSLVWEPTLLNVTWPLLAYKQT